LLAPSLFALSGLAGTLAYVLAVIHLAMTLITIFLWESSNSCFPNTRLGRKIVGPVLLLTPFYGF